MRHDCSQGYSFEAKAIKGCSWDSEGQKDAEEDIANVDYHIGQHRTERVLHSDEPTAESHQAESGGCGPDADVEIFKSQGTDFFGAAYEKENQFLEGPLDQEQGEGYDERKSDSPRKVADAIVPILPSESLGGHPACTGAQESEVPVQQVEHQGPDRDSTDQSRRGGVQMAGHRDVHHPDQRNGQVGENARQSQTQHLFVQCIHTAKVVIKWKYYDVKPQILFKRTNFIVYWLKEFTFVWLVSSI